MIVMNEKIFMKKKIWKYQIMAVFLFVMIVIGISLFFTQIISFVRTGTVSEDAGGSLRDVLIYMSLLFGLIYIPYNLWGFQTLIIDEDGFSPPVRRSFTYVVKRKNPHITWNEISKVEIYKKNAKKSGEMLAHTYRVYLKDEKFGEGVNNTFKSSKNPKKIFFEIPRKYKESSEALEEALKEKIPDKVEETGE